MQASSRHPSDFYGIFVGIPQTPTPLIYASNADPVCSKSERHGVILAAREEAEHASQSITDLAFRNERNSRLIAKS